jgi:hypothetical protein
MTFRENALRVSGILLISGLVAAAGYSLLLSRQAEQESGKVAVELASLYIASGARPTTGEVLQNLRIPTEENYPSFPTPNGVHQLRFNVDGQSVHAVFQGEAVASGWCFTVDYENSEAPVVNR